MAVVLIEEDLGRDVVGRAADRLLPFAREAYESGQAKVGDVQVHVGVEQQIAELEVAMDD